MTAALAPYLPRALTVALLFTVSPLLLADNDVQPTEQQSKIARTITRQLAVLHYARPQINDDLSQAAWQKLLDDMDPQRLYFLAGDIQGFEAWRTQLDDQLRAGQLQPTFTMFNRLQLRQRERLAFALAELDNKRLLDFSGHETLENDRKHAPWAASRQELDQLWRLRVKSAALGLKLAGKHGDDIVNTLRRRYKSQLAAIDKLKSDDVFQTVMNALTESVDPHSEYFSPRSSENFNINMSLQLEGIGAVLQTDDEYTKVVRLVPAGPADKSRQLKPNDRIIGVAEGDKDFVDVVGLRIDEVVQLIRGPKGTTVRLQVLPAGSSDTASAREITLVRNTVALEDQAASKRIIEIRRNGVTRRIGVIKLPAFYADFQGMQAGDPNYRSTTRDVRKLIGELKEERIQGLILDLRNNGGGSLTEVNDLLGEFIATGPTVQVRDARGKTEVLGDNDPEVSYAGPLAVLINRLSASASEIFAGAVQDYGRGLVMGGTSFGKGTVQSLRDLGSGQLKITEAKFYRISGASTQHKGVTPDIVFPELFDVQEIGESALPRALAWDTVPAARFQRLQHWDARLPALIAASRKRQATNPDFRYLMDEQKLLQQLRAIRVTSLNEKLRRSEKQQLEAQRLAIENRRRQAKGLPALKQLDDQDASADKSGNDPARDRPEEQALLTETGEILLDALSEQNAVRNTAARRPVSP